MIAAHRCAEDTQLSPKKTEHDSRTIEQSLPPVPAHNGVARAPGAAYLGLEPAARLEKRGGPARFSPRS